MDKDKCKKCGSDKTDICFNCYLSEKMEGNVVDKVRYILLDIDDTIASLKRDLDIIKIKLDKRRGDKKGI